MTTPSEPSPTSQIETIAAAIDGAELTAVVRRATGAPHARVANWSCQSLDVINGFGPYRGLFRFHASAEFDGGARALSLVLKVVRRPPRSSDDPTQPRFWRREAHAYQSPLLADMPGLRPARCFGIDTRDQETFTLWLEDLQDEHPDGWSPQRCGLAAQHLGEFNGAYLERADALQHPWLLRSRKGARIGAAAAHAIESLILDPSVWARPEVRRVFPESVAARVAEQWRRRHLLRAVIDELPTTLCHNDSHAQNLFSCRREDGTQETVALDWELIGLGPLAWDITYLVIATLRRFQLDMSDADALEAAVLEGYLAGLERSGWRGDPATVKLAFAAAIAGRVGLVPQILGMIMDASQRSRQEKVWRQSADALIEHWAQVSSFVLDRADSAREQLARR